ncbi:hypothetical protein ACFU5N_18185 [Streptomyces albidoflavus]
MAIRRRSLARSACVAAALALAAPLGVSSASAAQAADTCTYPQVCIQRKADGVIIGRFQDVTSTWQNMPSKPSNIWIINTRNDDVAYIRYANGGQLCVAPKQTVGTDYVATGIRISSSATCA